METTAVRTIQSCRGCGKYWLLAGGSSSLFGKRGPGIPIGRDKTRVHQCSCGTVSIVNPAERTQVPLSAFFPVPNASPEGNQSVLPVSGTLSSSPSPHLDGEGPPYRTILPPNFRLFDPLIRLRTTGA